MKELHQLPVPPSCENVTFRHPAAIRSRGWRSRKDTYPRLLRCIEKPGLNFQIGKERFVVAEAFQVCGCASGTHPGKAECLGKEARYICPAQAHARMGEGHECQRPLVP